MKIASLLLFVNLAIIFSGSGSYAQTATKITVRGVVQERGTQRRLADVNVFLLPQKLKAVSGPKGEFLFEGVEPGPIQIVVNFPGYLRLEREEILSETSTQENFKVLLSRESYQSFETTVVDQALKRDDTTRSLKSEQFLTVPGAQGDPVKAVQNLPGVARTGFGSQIIIQGSKPQDTIYLLDEHEVPLIFHFGGLTSVITPEAVDQVDYLSAGYGPEYGRAMGGVVGLKTRNPTDERLKGFVFVDTTKAGGLIESPIDDHSGILLTARYSYLGYVLAAVLKNNDAFDLTVAPSFADLAAIYHNRLSAKSNFRVTLLGSRDELKFLFKEPVRSDPAIRGNFNNQTDFYRLVPQWTYQHSEKTKSRWSLAMGQDFINVDIGENYFSLRNTSVTQRGEVEHEMSDSWKTYLGMDNIFSQAKVGLKLPVFNSTGGVSNPGSTGALQEFNSTVFDYSLGTYWRNQFKDKDSAWTYMPSLRLDYFALTRQVLPAPRFATRYDLTPHFFWRTASGIYFQPPEPQEAAADIGNPKVRAPWAWHLTTGLERDFREGSSRGWVVSSGVFYRGFENQVIRSSGFITNSDGALIPERYNNDGRGRAFGWENLLRFDFKPWGGWIAYTVSRATRTEPGVAEHAFQYDQTHNLTMVAQVDTVENWKFSIRTRFVTGNPMTPVTGGVHDSDNDVYVPIRGPIYSERMEPFFQTDIRADKKWIFEQSIMSLYVDVQNVANNRSAEAVSYSYDYSQKTTIRGLPILPTLGLRGEF